MQQNQQHLDKAAPVQRWDGREGTGGVATSVTFHDFGNISKTEPKTTRPTYYNFTAPSINKFTFTTASDAPESSSGVTFAWEQDNAVVFFGGLPWGAGDELYTRAPFRLQGGGQVTLSDGSLLHSASVWFPECKLSSNIPTHLLLP